MAYQPNRVGEQLGNYRLVRLLGEGGFAEVYLGEHIHLGTQAAIKVLRTRLTSNDFESFREEARTIAQFAHPHIVRVLEFGLEGATPFLVMDYAPGGTLRRRHPRGSILPVATVVSYVKQVADALQYTHEKRLIHRDVKPENMLLDRNDNVLLSDFGIALVAQSSRDQSMQGVTGTAAYMSPEQIQGKPRPASDQYSLGVVVYEWLCGDHPFRGSFTELCTQHMFASPPSLCEKVPGLSPILEQVVMRTLAKDPRQRFASVQEFATALQQASQLEQSQPHISSREKVPLRKMQLSTMLTMPANQSVPPTEKVLWLPGSSSQLIAPADPTVQVAQPAKSLSRRAVIAGMAGLTIVGGSGGIIWFARLHNLALLSMQSKTPLSSPSTRSTMPSSHPLGTALYTYHGHINGVNAVAWSPDGRRVASGSDDATVQVWNEADGSNVFTYREHSDGVYAVAWAPDGKYIASGSLDKTVQVWETTYKVKVFTYSGHSSNVYAVAWSPDGKRIASGSKDGTAKVWDAVDGGKTFTYSGHSSDVYAVAWSPDGKRVASGSGDATVRVWNEADGGNVFAYRGHSGGVNAVAWSPDGKYIASGSLDNTVQIWDAAYGTRVFTYRGHSNYVSAVAWSPDGKRIASASPDLTVQVWDVADGGNIFTYRGHADSVNAVAWSPDGKRIASGSSDKTVQIWVAS